MRIRPVGPVPARVMIVGDMPGKDDDIIGMPFLGSSGKELKRMLEQAGFDWKACFLTNVFLDMPEGNDVKNFCAKRGDVGKDYPYLPLSPGNYVRPERARLELGRLADEVRACRPDLIIALGNVACWALIGRTGISKLRGSVFPCTLVEGVSVLPTHHPSSVMRDWSLRVITVGDLLKAKRAITEGLTIPRRELWLDPSLDEVRDFCARFILGDRPRLLSFDIETFAETITCIGFAPTRDRAITIPFFDPRKPDRNYWATAEDELVAWKICVEVLRSDIPKVGQNGLYDIQYLHKYGVMVSAYQRDTMIRHHSLYPELEKGLGFLASVYTDEPPWKVLRDRNRDNFKIDDE